MDLYMDLYGPYMAIWTYIWTYMARILGLRTLDLGLQDPVLRTLYLTSRTLYDPGRALVGPYRAIFDRSSSRNWLVRG